MFPNIVIHASFACDSLQFPLEICLNDLIQGIESKIYWIPYGDFNECLQDPSSQLNQNSRGFTIVLLRLIDLLNQHPEQNNDSVHLLQSVQIFVNSIQQSASYCKCPMLLFICPEITNDEVYVQAENAIVSQLKRFANIHVYTQNEILDRYGLTNYYDSFSDQVLHDPYQQDFYDVLAITISRKLYPYWNREKKVIVLDCDNTLWGGVVGEMDVEHLTILGGYLFLQKFVLELKNSGYLLCLCSKNVESDIIKVFSSRKDSMVLSFEKDIVCSRINWLPKWQNIQSIAKELSLNLDSFVFIDDNPLECSEMEMYCPEVVTLCLPKKSDHFSNFLSHCWDLDTCHRNRTNEDALRTISYQANLSRKKAFQEATSPQAFRASLNMKIKVEPMTSKEVQRISQLDMRTTQFNCSMKRLSIVQVQELLDKDSMYFVTVTDRFGHYGLCGCFSVLNQSDNALLVRSFVVSCRVLNRGIEHKMLHSIASIAKKRGKTIILVEWIQTEKNIPAYYFFSSLPNVQLVDHGTKWKISVETAMSLQYNGSNESFTSDKTNQLDLKNKIIHYFYKLFEILPSSFKTYVSLAMTCILRYTNLPLLNHAGIKKVKAPTDIYTLELYQKKMKKYRLSTTYRDRCIQELEYRSLLEHLQKGSKTMEERCKFRRKIRHQVKLLFNPEGIIWSANEKSSDIWKKGPKERTSNEAQVDNTTKTDERKNVAS